MHETSAQGWCTGKTQRDGMEREVGGGIRMGNTCKSMADSCIAKPLQYCKVISLQLIKINGKKKWNINAFKKGYFPFTIIANYWLYSLCCAIHLWVSLTLLVCTSLSSPLYSLSPTLVTTRLFSVSLSHFVFWSSNAKHWFLLSSSASPGCRLLPIWGYFVCTENLLLV